MKSSLFILSEEGKLEEDLSLKGGSIPELMSEGSFKVVHGKLYAVGGVERNLAVLEGKKWK